MKFSHFLTLIYSERYKYLYLIRYSPYKYKCKPICEKIKIKSYNALIYF